MTTQKIKGSILKSRLAFVEQQFGREGLQKVMDSLEPEDQAQLQHVLPVAWLKVCGRFVLRRQPQTSNLGLIICFIFYNHLVFAELMFIKTPMDAIFSNREVPP